MKGLFSNASLTIICLGIIALVGLTIFVTENLLAFLGLLFIFYVVRSPELIPTTCPKCGHEFIAIAKEDSSDEE